jgi:hypothetical protein
MLSEKLFKSSVILISAVTLAFFALPPLFLVVRGINNQAWRRLPDSGVSEATAGTCRPVLNMAMKRSTGTGFGPAAG